MAETAPQTEGLVRPIFPTIDSELWVWKKPCRSGQFKSTGARLDFSYIA